MGVPAKHNEATFNACVESAIQATEHYYREQIFSSGCSSMVPIYRISDNTKMVNSLITQLQGSPYIQKDVVFSERVIENLLEVTLYLFEEKHFFFQGDMSPEIQTFVDEKCQAIHSFSELAQKEWDDAKPHWMQLDQAVATLINQFPILEKLNVTTLVEQTMDVLTTLDFDVTLKTYLDILHTPKWKDRISINQSTLLCMVAIANELRLRESERKNLVTLGLLKDIGYTRLSDHIDNFEILHPLVSHKLVEEYNHHCRDPRLQVPSPILNSLLVHHEFMDDSGPLARMRHPSVQKVLGINEMPIIGQISGLCDLYFGFMNHYSPGVSFAITCGFVVGQGNLPHRYHPEVVRSFVAALEQGSQNFTIPETEARNLLNTILNLIKDSRIRQKTFSAIGSKTSSWYDRITLALNIVRNIAKHQPEHLSEDGLITILHLPAEFGLNY